jgi:hypothetical protein
MIVIINKMEISGDVYDIDQTNRTFKIKSGNTVYSISDPKLCTCHLQRDYEWSNILTGMVENRRVYTVLKRKVLDAFISEQRNFNGQFGHLMACCEGCKFSKEEIESDPVIARKSAITYQIYSKNDGKYVYYASILSDIYLDYIESKGIKISADLVETEII